MFKRICLFLVLIILLTVSVSSASRTAFFGKVVGVSDGDTITVFNGEESIKIRLYGIDCPESGQAYGKNAKQFISSIVFGKTVNVTVYDTDRYGRTVGVVRVAGGGPNANEALVKNGYAWKYTKYCKELFCDDWMVDEYNARRKSLGLWHDDNPIAPWDWRKSKKKSYGQSSLSQSKKSVPASHNMTATRLSHSRPTSTHQNYTSARLNNSQPTSVRQNYTSGGVLHGNTKSHIYHNSGCSSYNCKNCTRIFHSASEAQAAGYRACKKCGG